MSEPVEGVLLQSASQWKCLPCIAEAKMATMQGVPVDQLPEVRDAVTILNGTAHCVEHIAVQAQSSLLVPGSRPAINPM